jgi:two-component sensor histidine kinase
MTAGRFLKRFAKRQPGAIGTAVGAILFVAGPTGLRLILDSVFVEQACFALYFPAILLGALLLGWRVGVLVALLSAVAVDHLPVGRALTMGLANGGVLVAAEYWVSAALIIVTAELLRRTYVRLSAAVQTARALNLELRHRVNNSLAMALAFAAQTKRSAPEPEVFFATFQSRLTALARANDILSSGNAGECRLPQLADAALEAFAERGQISISGRPCNVPVASCVPLVLALHELATNAVKHGALSAPKGTVALDWTIHGEDARSEVRLQWLERGGPPVGLPIRKGLGSRLLVRQAGLDEVSVAFAPAGLECMMVVRGITSEPAARAAGGRRLEPSM